MKVTKVRAEKIADDVSLFLSERTSENRFAQSRVQEYTFDRHSDEKQQKSAKWMLFSKKFLFNGKTKVACTYLNNNKIISQNYYFHYKKKLLYTKFK